MNAHRNRDAGFTLIETLVALTVLSVGAMTLLTAVERHASASRMLADRIVARWVAENALAATTLGLDVAPRWRSAMGIDWAVRLEARGLPDTGLSAVTARVADAAEGPDAELVSLTGYTTLTETTQ
ncbi:general secretion pathway protein I [Sulfitobacter noctilucae]|uniref:type II secretion system minor pseudopilin GspI n=1 Tax=Sulfitobacter noctilucae TaxID=1342302 RepID=UPI0004691A75|nr:type II secretion system minor pseudopilin GspI [Sulfitobacter noctilucae]KIN74985.1 general secretion pathway protein I [Sulfitobacter noctilucae]